LPQAAGTRQGGPSAGPSAGGTVMVDQAWKNNLEIAGVVRDWLARVR
jgi:hypothetical protein